MRLLRLGVAGVGGIALSVHLPCLLRQQDVGVVAFADPSEQARARALALAPSARSHDGLAEMIAAGGLDAVIVASPSGAHAAQALEVMAAALHLYVEKPLATSAADLQAVTEAAVGASASAVAGFNRRLHPLVVRLRVLVAAGAVGTVERIEGAFHEPCRPDQLPAWKRERASGGGAGLDLVCHHVDLARHLLGVEIVEARGAFRSLHTEHDDVTLELTLGDGVEAVLHGSFVRPRADVLRVHGSAGSLVLDRFAGTLRGTGAGRVPSPAGLALRARCRLRPGHDPSYASALRAFAQAARGASPGALATLTDGARAVEALLRAGG